MSATIIHFVRHGEVHNPDQILYSRLPDFRLSENGRQQAEAAGNFLAQRPISAIYASPQPRTQETAGYIAKHHALPIQTAELLNEVYTPYEGRPHADLDALGWDLYTGIDPAYEQPEDVLARTQAFIQQVRQDHAGQEVVAVSHGDVLFFYFLQLRGEVATAGYQFDLRRLGLAEAYPATAGIITYTFEADADLPEFVYTRPY
jgi:broad specificity phosphatase PhoE